jgi:RimJ/RimL family protein N-acetyltransferase
MRIPPRPAVARETPYEIRTAQRRDAAALWELSRGLHHDEPQAGLLETAEWHVTVDQLAAFVTDIARTDNGLCLVAALDEHAIGSLTLEGGRYRKTRHVAEMGVIVHRKWRRCGVASVLTRAAIDAARTSDVIKKLALRLFSNNDAALRLYESLHFRQEGRRAAQIRLADGYVDEILMGLDVF